MATTVTITPSTTSISATAQTTTLTISSAIASSVGTTASNVSLGSPVGTLTGQNTVEGALNFLANQFYVATSAPSADTTNLAEGDLFYDTDDNQLKIYRETSSGNFEFVPIMIGNSSADSDTVDAGGF
jgi:hypothetical protein